MVERVSSCIENHALGYRRAKSSSMRELFGGQRFSFEIKTSLGQTKCGQIPGTAFIK